MPGGSETLTIRKSDFNCVSTSRVHAAISVHGIGYWDSGRPGLLSTVLESRRVSPNNRRLSSTHGTFHLLDSYLHELTDEKATQTASTCHTAKYSYYVVITWVVPIAFSASRSDAREQIAIMTESTRRLKDYRTLQH